MLAIGKALHLACEFERQYGRCVLNVAEMFANSGDAKATFATAKTTKDAMLRRTIAGTVKIRL